MTTQSSPVNLDQLTDRYEILGELSGRDDARTFMARRREDKRDVLVLVARAPDGDEGNALSHLAADVNLLSTLEHSSLLKVLEGRWLDDATFAVVLERGNGPSLHELLSRREEQFEYPRIANILKDVNSVLEWARDNKIVHRLALPETVFIEPGSDRVAVAFAISSLQRHGVPGPDADARNIAALARAMLTRSPMDPERDERPLAEVRPGLPNALVEETDALLGESRDGQSRDVTQYIARIAMAEALKTAEEHMERARDAIKKQQELHREQLEKERQEHDKQLTNERREHERQAAEQAKQFARERESYARELTKQRGEVEKERVLLVKEHENLAKEREAHARDCDRLMAERAEHAKEKAAWLDQRAAYDRAAKEQQRQFAAQAAALEARARAQLAAREAHAREVAEATAREAHARDVAEAAARDARAREDAVTATREQHKELPPAAVAAAVAAVASMPRSEVVRYESAPRRNPLAPWLGRFRAKWAGIQWGRIWQNQWGLPAVAVVLVLIIAMTATGLGRHHGRARSASVKTQDSALLRTSSRRTFVDSSGGEAYESTVPLPWVTNDTQALARNASDWLPTSKGPFSMAQPTSQQPTSQPAAAPQVEDAAAQEIEDARAQLEGIRARRTPRPDTAARSPQIFPPSAARPAPNPAPIAVGDSSATRRLWRIRDDTSRRDTSLFRPRRDSIPRIDSVPKRDTTLGKSRSRSR